MKIEETYNHLRRFNEFPLTLGEPILDNRLEEFENKYGIKLTSEFKYIYRKHNGFGLSGVEVMGLGEEFRGGSLDKYYEMMHKYFQNFIPKEFVPISRDGWGNYYCLDLSRCTSKICPIVFWQHDYEYSVLSDIETCNNSFAEWIDEVMIDWTLQEYDYEGSRKDGLVFKTKNFFNKLLGRAQSETAGSKSYPPRYKIEIKVSIPKSNSADSLMTITKDGILFKTIHSTGIKYDVAFDLNAQYLIECSKEGFTTKVISFDANVPIGRESEEFGKHSFVIELFKKEQDDVSDTSKPIGVIQYNPEIDDFYIVKATVGEPPEKSLFNSKELTSREIQLCDELGFDHIDALLLKKSAQCEINKFDFEHVELGDKPNCIFVSSNERQAQLIVHNLQKQFIKKGQFIYIGDYSFSSECKVVLINTTNDPYKIIEYAETNGINFDINTEDVLAKVKNWDSRFGLKFYGIGFDFLLLKVVDKNIDLKNISKEINEFCPDNEDLDHLEKELKTNQEIFLWWD